MNTTPENQDDGAKPTGEAPLAAAIGSAFLVDCNAYGKEPLEYKTISEALADNRIVNVTKEYDGRFCVEEGCDNYFRGYLTREQLLAWSDELRALAGMPNEKLSHAAGDRDAASGKD